MSAEAFAAMRDDPKFAQAIDILCDRSRVELGTLIYNPWLPETLLDRILEWIDDLAAGDPSAAFELDTLEGVFPALGVAWLVSFSYAGRPMVVSKPGDPDVVVEMREVGDAGIVERALDLLYAIAPALHGEQGADLVHRTAADMHEKVTQIARMVARHS